MCNKTRHPHALRRRARTFLADARGLAAVELAMILPLALMLLSLVVYGGQAYWVQRKVTLAATTVANIFAQANNNNQSTITAAELNQILDYPNLILYPYNGSHRCGRGVATAGHRQWERDRDRHGLRQLGQRQRNGPPDGPAIVGRPVDRFRLFQLEQQRQSRLRRRRRQHCPHQLCGPGRSAVSVRADRNLFPGELDDPAQLDHHDPAGREPDHRAGQ